MILDEGEGRSGVNYLTTSIEEADEYTVEHLCSRINIGLVLAQTRGGLLRNAWTQVGIVQPTLSRCDRGEETYSVVWYPPIWNDGCHG